MLSLSFGRKARAAPREAERHGLSLVTALRGERGIRGSILIRDLSSHGFRADCLLRIAKGDDVLVDMPGSRDVEARVEWARGEQIGVRFKQPIPLPATLAALGID